MLHAHECDVIHIDDNANDVELFEFALVAACVKPRHYQGITDPVRGLQCLLEASPACKLVVLDLNMPRLNGFEVLTRLRADPRGAHLRVVVFSTSRSATDHDRCLLLGARAYVTKPASFGELCTAAQTIMAYC